MSQDLEHPEAPGPKTQSQAEAQIRAPDSGKGEQPGDKEMRDCFSCLALLVFGLVLVFVVAELSFTPP